MTTQTVELREPKPEDGFEVNQLIANCPPLDSNSVYCNLLQCSHFADSSVIAVRDLQPVGFISGYLVPARQDTLFIWQVAVDDSARGQGLATRMLKHILDRQHSSAVHYLETTITASNQASWSLFRGLARALDAQINESVMFDRERHLGNQHDTEHLVRIGPF